MPYRPFFRLSIVALAANRGKGLGIPSGERARHECRGTRDKTNHMALYTQKFIAADYLARVQTQTHFFLRPLVRRVVRERERVRGSMSEESHRWKEGEVERGWVWYKEKQDRNATRGWDEGRCSERESGKHRRWARVVELSACSLPLLVRPCIQDSPPLERRGSEGISPAKTCIAFYCRIDCLNNSQRGNPSPITHRAVCAFPSRSPSPSALQRAFNYVIRSVLLLLLSRMHNLYMHSLEKMDHNLSDWNNARANCGLTDVQGNPISNVYLSAKITCLDVMFYPNLCICIM